MGHACHDEMSYYGFKDNGDTVEFNGVDIGLGMRKYPVYARKGNIIIVYVKGHSWYGGLRGDRTYVPAEFHVFEKVCEHHVNPLITFTCRKAVSPSALA